MAYTERYVTVTGAGTHDGTSEANAFTWAEFLASTENRAGKRYNVKSGSYTSSDTGGMVVSGGAPTAAAPCMIRGYNTTIGDLAANGRTGGTGALVTTNFPTITYSSTGFLTTAAFTILQNVTVDAVVNSNTLLTGNQNIIYRCNIRNTHGTGAATMAVYTSNSYSSVIDCDLYNNSVNTAAFVVSCDRGHLIHCRVEGAGGTNSAAGVSAVTFASIIGNQIFNVSAGVQHAFFTVIYGNSFRNVADTVIKSTADATLPVINNVAWGDGSTNFYAGVTSIRPVFLSNNAFGNRGATADTNKGDWFEQNVVTLTADPFVSATDLKLNATSGGGADAKVAGMWPYEDIGAVQADPGASGGGSSQRVIGG